MSDPDEKEPRPTGQEVMVEETRRVLDRQAAEIEHIDNKAAKSVRYIVLILGVLASAYSFAPDAPTPTLLTGAGVVCLGLSLLTGMLTYTNSRIWVGASPDRLSVSLGADTSASTVRGELLKKYPSKVQKNRNMITGDAFGLLVTQALFLLGAVAVAVDLFLI